MCSIVPPPANVTQTFTNISSVIILIFYLSGGRDRKGGPIVTIQPLDDSDVGPINMGKLMTYLSKIPR